MNGRKAHAAGALKSLNRTITDVMEFLDNTSERPAAELRAFLNEKLGDLSKHWYQKGFNRGHRQSCLDYEVKGMFPSRISYKCSKNLFNGDARELRLRSRLKNAL